VLAGIGKRTGGVRTLQVGSGGYGLSGHEGTGCLGGTGVGAAGLDILQIHEALMGCGSVPLCCCGLLEVDHSWNEVLPVFSMVAKGWRVVGEVIRW